MAAGAVTIEEVEQASRFLFIKLFFAKGDIDDNLAPENRYLQADCCYGKVPGIVEAPHMRPEPSYGVGWCQKRSQVVITANPISISWKMEENLTCSSNI